MSRFGENLRKIRNERGMSQDEMAALLGTSKQVISRYENGQRNPKVSVAQDYADRLGVTIGYLTGDSTGEEDIAELKTRIKFAQDKLHDISESLPTAKPSRGWQALSRGFSRAEGDPEEYTMSDIDYALSDEIQDLSETDKQEILDYIRFKRAQKAKKEQQP